MLARFGRVHLPPPGGDVIGRRRVDTHFLALERLGAEVTVGATYQLEAKKLAGADIFLDEPSELLGLELVGRADGDLRSRSEEHTSELQSLAYLVCPLLLEKKKYE